MTAPISMEYAAPPAEMQRWISSLYRLHQESPTFEEVERADRPQLRIMLRGGGEYRFANGHVDPARPVTLIGPTSGAITDSGFGPMYVVGAGLHPTAWTALTGLDAEQSLDRAFDGREIFGNAAQILFDAIDAESETAPIFKLLCDFVAAQTAARGEVMPHDFIAIMDAWLAENDDVEVADLVARTGLSSRQVERLSKRFYGLPPKSLLRKYRALHAAAALARGEDITANGMASQFYDQSHLIRELKRFAGLTPEQIKARQSELLIAISEGRKSLTGQVDVLVSNA